MYILQVSSSTNQVFQGETVKQFTMRYAVQTGHHAEEKDFRFGDDASPRVVYQTAKKETPEGKELREIKFDGKILWKRGWFRGAPYRRAFPPR